MNPDDIITSLEEGKTQPLRLNAGLEGISQAYFERIGSHLGTAPERARSLSRHFRLVLKFGDREDFAWRGLGAALRASGDWAKSGNAFVRAGLLAQQPVDRHLFRLGAIDSFARAGLMDRAISIGRSAALGLERLGEPDLAARARLNLGNALIWGDKYSLAIREYLKVLSAEVSDYERAAAQLGLSTSYLFHGRTRDVRDLAEAAERGFRVLGMSHFTSLARLNVSQALILQGRPEDAWAILREIAPSLEKTDEHARVLEFQADAALALNLSETASELYSQALALLKNPLNQGNCLLGQARALVAIGEPENAQPSFSKAARRYRRAENEQWQCVSKMELARSRKDKARLTLAALSLQKSKSRYWEAVAWLNLAVEGDYTGLHRAAQLVAVNGYVNLIWWLRWMQARKRGTLHAYRRMAQALLADRLTTVSVAARMGFLRDKRDAMLEYLRLLLERGKPRDLREIVEFVQQTRSAALFDELSAGSEFGPLRSRVESIRSAIQEGGTDGARQAVALSIRGVTTELDRVLKTYVRDKDTRATGDVWVDYGEGFAAITGETYRVLDSACIKSSLRWLWFEMMAPLTNKSAHVGPVMKLVEHLRSQLGAISSWICPDGALWAAPWAVLSEKEPTVALNPAFGQGCVESLPADARVAIWYHEALDLPSISSEVKSIKAAFPQAVLCGSRKTAIDSLSETWDYVHVATHARLNASNPMFSYFEFSDGPLFAIEVSRSSLKVELAVLAACDTGRLDTTLRDEPDGIVRAFLARGARSVIAGQWLLDDEAAALTMQAFAARLAQGDSAVVALGRARQITRTRFPHPYFWGSLVHFAGYETQKVRSYEILELCCTT